MLKVKATQRVLDPTIESNDAIEKIIKSVVGHRKQQHLKRTYRISDYRLSMILKEKKLKTSEFKNLTKYNSENFSAPTHDEGEE
jgi:hypothetical protein